MNSDGRHETVVKITDFKLGMLGPHGILTTRFSFDTEDDFDGDEQLFVDQYRIDHSFIEGVLAACGVETVDEIEGTVLKVEYIPSGGIGGRAPEVRALKPLNVNSGTTFDITEWQEELE